MAVQEVKPGAKDLSRVCVAECRGVCCDPWWGVIRYGLEKPGGGPGGLDRFKKDVARSIRERVERIKTSYVTDENPPRRLFGDPERYNVVVENIRPTATGIAVELCAMFAFRCIFLSPDKTCAIHPALTGSDVRPPHCAALGAPDSKEGGQGHCRIIGAAVASSFDEGKIRGAVEFEKKISARHYNEGAATIDGAAELVIQEIRARLPRPGAAPHERAERPGRNDPCHCGSGLKYKKCHGR